MNTFFKRLFKFFSSIRLTVFVLGFGVILVFFSTLDQVHIGIQGIVVKYFKSWFAVWSYPEQWWWYDQLKWVHLPMPGGTLLGIVMIVNLACAHFRYFRPSWKKAGIVAIHLGIVLLIVGQGITDRMQREYRMVIDEGKSTNFLVNSDAMEMVIIDVTDPEKDTVTAIPTKLLKKGERIEREELPFSIEVKNFYENAAMGVDSTGEKVQFTHGAGKVHQITLSEQDVTGALGALNLASADVELLDKEGESLGRWLASVHPANQFRGQTLEVDGRTFLIDIRLERLYLDYEVALIDFSHDRYPKTNKPFNYSSDVKLTNHETDEVRETRIWMNHPLRYDNKTFFQADFADQGRTTVLQVVENIGKWIPYIAFIVVTLGMLFQFTFSLIIYSNKRQKTV